jgi:hypothetical protein
MRTLALLCAAICLGVAPVRAEVKILDSADLNPEQKRAAYETLFEPGSKVEPETANVGVGSKLPRSVKLRSVPRHATTRKLRRYRYTMSGDRVVLVDPKSRQVVLILGVGF